MQTDFSQTIGPIDANGERCSERLPEPFRVLCWRMASLLEAGYSEAAAALLAIRPRVDLHQAVDLLAQGCPPDTALRILL